MNAALKVAEAALWKGEVPVGCIVVLRDATSFVTDLDTNMSTHDDDGDKSVIISHGANQVNACRDATRHAEIVAIDRILTGSVSCDFQNGVKDKVCAMQNGNKRQDIYSDRWENIKEDKAHWKNSFGWGSGRIFKNV